VAEQRPVPRGVTVDFTSRSVHDPFVLEVGGQRVVICGEGACTSDNCQRQHVEIVRYAHPNGTQAPFLALKPFGVGGPEAPRPVQLHELPSHTVVLRKFFPQLARRHEAWSAAFPKEPVNDGTGLHQEPGGDVCINNQAHVRHPEDRVLP